MWLVLTEESQGGSRGAGFILCLWLSVIQCCVLESGKIYFQGIT